RCWPIRSTATWWRWWSAGCVSTASRSSPVTTPRTPTAAPRRSAEPRAGGGRARAVRRGAARSVPRCGDEAVDLAEQASGGHLGRGEECLRLEADGAVHAGEPAGRGGGGEDLGGHVIGGELDAQGVGAAGMHALGHRG